jgi:hypothetical protein
VTSALAASVFTRASYPDRLERPVARAPKNVTPSRKTHEHTRFSPATLHPFSIRNDALPEASFLNEDYYI